MKKLTFIILFVITLVSCESRHSNSITKELSTNKEEITTRIHVIEGTSFTRYRILEVDGHEYLSGYEGGIVHLESCPCKNK